MDLPGFSCLRNCHFDQRLYTNYNAKEGMSWLVMVGSEDLRTPLSEAKQLYHSLKIRQIETGLVVIPGSYHFIANRPSQLITKIEHIVAWFDRYRK